MKSITARTCVSIGLLITSFMSFVFIFYQFLIDPNTRGNIQLLILLGTFSFLAISEKIGAVLSDILSDKEFRAAHETLEQFPSLLAGRQDIITFPNSTAATRHLIASSRRAIDVKNT